MVRNQSSKSNFFNTDFSWKRICDSKPLQNRGFVNTQSSRSLPNHFPTIFQPFVKCMICSRFCKGLAAYELIYDLHRRAKEDGVVEEAVTGLPEGAEERVVHEPPFHTDFGTIWFWLPPGFRPPPSFRPPPGLSLLACVAEKYWNHSGIFWPNMGGMCSNNIF